MKAAFRFFRSHDLLQFEEEFRNVYQEPGVRLLAVGFCLAAFVFGVFYALDVIVSGFPLTGGVQTFRLVVLAFLVTSVAGLLAAPAFSLRYYTAIGMVAMGLALQAAAYTAFAARRDLHYIEMYWAMTSSMATAIICVFGFSRLTATASLLVTLSGTAAAIVYATQIPGHVQQLGRLITHLVVANIVCFLLRSTIQSRERKVFLQGKEVLAKSEYAHRLEVANLAAAQAEETKARFLASMSHEVRTPMSGVLQILEVVRPNLPPSDQALVDRGCAAGHALLRVLNTILDYTKLSAGATPLHLSPVNLIACINTVVDLFQASAIEKGISLRHDLEIEPGCEVLMTDEVKLVEILNNLVSNAIKFTDRGFVMISVSAQPDALDPKLADVHLEVQDTGVGISEVDQADLFRAFYQSPSRLKGKPVGTGLGLAIVQQLVDLLEGEVSLSSEPGSGAVFRVQLKAKIVTDKRVRRAMSRSTTINVAADSSASFSPLGEEPTSLRPLQSRKLRVLLAEDNKVNAELATFFLNAYGCSVTQVADGFQALQAFRGGDFDVVLMDCLMPVLDGFEATQEIRDYERNTGKHRTPIIAVTANTLAGDREQCIAIGMDDFLAKPYSRAQLGDILIKWSNVRPPSPAMTSVNA